MEPRQLSYELRLGASPDLKRRRWIIGLSLVGTAMAQLISLYQTGIISRMPDPPLPLIDSNRVDASDYAYKRFQTPDAFLMLMTYGVTAALAAAGGQHRAAQAPAIPIAMGLKLLLDSAQNLRLTSEEWSENQALCFYCQVAALCSLASTAIAIPEVLSAINTLRGQPAPTPQIASGTR